MRSGFGGPRRKALACPGRVYLIGPLKHGATPRPGPPRGDEHCLAGRRADAADAVISPATPYALRGWQ